MYDYKPLRSCLEDLVGRFQQVITREELDDVAGFIDAAEYGLAFETVRDILTERGIRLPHDTYSLLEHTGRQMDLDPATWNHLKE